jgi:pyridoxamine 5'-phosphate oxidase
MRLADVRKPYREGELDLTDLHPNPIEQFRAWMADALSAGLLEPNAMALATVDEGGQPSVRMVLLKGLEADAFVFYTNTLSRKGGELRANPRCALSFWWDKLERQVRVEGVATPVPDSVADAYFASRPRASQLGAWSSPQSTPIEGRGVLQANWDAANAAHPNAVPRPVAWSGYAVAPHAIEFWQGRASRLHDRFRYQRSGQDWTCTRLAP